MANSSDGSLIISSSCRENVDDEATADDDEKEVEHDDEDWP